MSGLSPAELRRRSAQADWHASHADGLMRLVAELGVINDDQPVHEDAVRLAQVATGHALTALALRATAARPEMTP